MKKKLMKYIERKVDEKDNRLTRWYWRKRYNTLELELDVLKQVMADDVYKAVLNSLSDVEKVSRLEKDNKTLRQKNKLLREENIELRKRTK